MSIKDNFPSVGPSLSLNFARSKTLDPRITFSRPSTFGDATYMNGNGLIVTAAADEPRFDHKIENGVVKSLGLLIEQQRTNLILYSNDFSQSNWTKQNSHPTPSKNAVGPDGVANSASTVYRTATNQYLFQSISGGGTYTLSAWVKSEAATGSFNMQGYNVTDGTMAESFTATNEWQRFETTISPTTNTGYYPCIPTNTNTNFYVWGVQVESGSFKTSYIPTSGSEATRSPDEVSMTGTNFSDWYNQTEGTLFTQYNTIGSKNNQMVAQIRSDNGDNRVEIRAQGSGSSVFRVEVIDDGATQAQEFAIAPSGFTAENFHKITLGYKENDFASTINGTLYTDNSGTVDSCDYMMIGDANYSYGSPTGTGRLNGHISQLTYYPKRLTNTQLQNLTK